MANFIDKLGLGFLMETEEDVETLWRYVASQGNPIVGYYADPYFNHHFGDAQLILRSTIHPDNHLEVLGMDTHASGASVWNVRLSAISIPRKDSDRLERRCVVSRVSDGSGMAVVNIVNADVLPSFCEGEEVQLQMIAFPSFIEYFKDEDEYKEAQPESTLGPSKKFLLADGTVMPSGLLANRSPASSSFESNDDLDDLMMIRGTVKKLYVGKAQLGEETFNAYVRCIIDTEHGELEIVHTMDDVAEEHRGNIRVGATVNGLFFLSGDAAIYEYENGIVLDEKNNLAILRATFEGADPERMRRVFSEDAVYYAQFSDTTYVGRDEIINRLKYVAENTSEPYFAHLATIVDVDEGEDLPVYGVGKRCIVLAAGDKHQYESIAFAELDENGQISKLTTSTDSRYHFKLDEKPIPRNVLDEIEKPESPIQLMFSRACYHHLIDDKTEILSIVSAAKDNSIYDNNARRMIEAMPRENEEQNLENLFGYLFAKAVEAEFANMQRQGSLGSDLIARYVPDDAWEGVIDTPLDEEHHRKIENAMKLGKQFAKDFILFHPCCEPHDEQYEEALITSLVFVQQIGEMYAPIWRTVQN